MPRWRLPRPRFSLLTLLLGVLFVGACGGLWYRWEPWVCDFVLRGVPPTDPGLFPTDGRRLITTCTDGSVYLWDAQTGRLLVEFKGHTDSVCCVCFSPDGQQIVTSSKDRTVRLWDTDTGREVALLKRHDPPILLARFLGDSAVVVTVGECGIRYLDPKSEVMSNATLNREWYFPSNPASPDGRETIAVGENNTVYVRDIETGEDRAVLAGHLAPVRSAVFSPDGRRVATASEDATARIWDTEAIQKCIVLKGHTGTVHSVAFSPDGRRVATAGEDTAARVWDAETGEECAVLAGHAAAVRSVTFSPDGQQILTASEDGTARIWNGGTGWKCTVLRRPDYVIDRVFFAAGGRRIVAVRNHDMLWTWHAATSLEIPQLSFDHCSCPPAFPPNGRWLVTVGDFHTARVLDAETGYEHAVLRGHTEDLEGFCFSPDGRWIITWSADFTARLWDAETGSERAVLAGHTNYVYGVGFSQDGRRIITWGGDGTARLWDAKTGQEQAVLRGHADYVTNAEFSPDGRWVVTSDTSTLDNDTDDAVRVWNAETGREHMVVKEEGFPLTGRFSPDSQRIVTNAQTVWNVATCEELPLRGVVALDISPDGKQIVAVDDDNNRVGLWDAETCQNHVVIGSDLEAHYAKFSPDGQRIATFNQIDETTRLWSRRRPEFWWGIAWLPEFWVALFSGGALSVIAARNLRRAEGTGRRTQHRGKRMGPSSLTPPS